jgi:hypothetical protein
LLSKISAHQLDLLLPSESSSSSLEVRLEGKRLPIQLIDEAGRQAETSRAVRLQVEPALYPKPAVLEVKYQVDVVRLSGNRESQGPFYAALRPPSVRDAVLLGRTRWQIELPAGWMPVYAGGNSIAEQRWRWQGWLLTPRPTLNHVELEEWFTGSDKPLRPEDGEPGFICWQTTLSALPLIYVPERAWLLACSLIFLVLSLALLFAPFGRILFWSCLMFSALVLVSVGLLWPETFPAAVYGCEPGAYVLLLFGGVEIIRRRLYRRRVVAMPGFRRLTEPPSVVLDGHNKPRGSSTPKDPKRSSSVSSKVEA